MVPLFVCLPFARVLGKQSQGRTKTVAVLLARFEKLFTELNPLL